MTWEEIEKLLYKTSVDVLRAFAKDHIGESFYGFAFACNADYGEVMLCLNSEHGLYASSEVDSELWSPGDWEYPNINTDSAYSQLWETAWAETQDAIEEACLADDGEDVPEIFLESVCRVLIAMEKHDEFNCISCAPHFRTFVIDHDETQEDAWERLRVVREAEARS